MNPRDTKTLLGLLRGIEAALLSTSEDIARISKQIDSDKKEQEVQPNDITPAAELNFPPAIREYYEAKNRDQWGPRLKAILEVGALGAAIWLGILNLNVLRQVEKQTPKIAESADASLGTSLVSAQQMKTSEEANWLTRSNAISSQQQSRAALNASIQQFHLDQRAWVAATNITGVPEVDKPFVVRITGKNAGKTFAKQFRMIVAVESGPPRVIKFDAERHHAPESISLLSPNGEYTSETIVTGEHSHPHHDNPDQIAMDNIRNGSVQIVAFGRMDYVDIFNVQHWSTFCFRLDRGEKWQSCKEHNDADNN